MTGSSGPSPSEAGPLRAAAGLVVGYVRGSERRRVAVTVGVAPLQIYQSVAGGSTEPLVDTVVRVAGWPLAGVGLIALGVWLHSADL